MGDQNVVLRTWRVWPKDRISQELNSWNHQHCSSAIVFDSVLTINRLVIAGHLYVAHHSPALDISGQHLPNAWMSNDRSPMSLHISNPCRNIFIHILYAMRKKRSRRKHHQLVRRAARWNGPNAHPICICRNQLAKDSRICLSIPQEIYRFALRWMSPWL